MKFLIITLFIFVLTLSTKASNYEQLFSFNENAVAAEMGDLYHLEQLINDGKTEDALKIYFQNTPADSTDNYVKRPNKTMTENDAFYLGLAGGCIGFFTGFFLGPIAVFYVYHKSDKDMVLTKKAAQGCAIPSGGCPIAFVVAYFALGIYRI